MKALLFLLIAAGLAFAGWYVLSGDGTGGSGPYPVPRVITSADGRKLDSMIIGKKGNTIFLRRKADGREFKLTTDSLSAEDADFVSRLPDGGADGSAPARPLIWHESLAEARTDARRRGVPVFILFEGTDW